MRRALQVLTVAVFLPPVLSDGTVYPALAGLCLPNSTRYTKCIDGKVADCTRSRNVKCKTREQCKQTEQPCTLPQLIR